MFTRDELLAAFENIDLEKLVLKVVSLCRASFGQDDFDRPSDEMAAEVHRAPRHAFSSALEFWLTSSCGQGWNELEDNECFVPDQAGALCTPLLESEFNMRARSCVGSLVKPLPLPLHPPHGFEGAMLMHDDWDEIGLFAVYEDEFISVFWSTTA